MHGGIQKIAGPQENGLKQIKQQIGTIRTILAPAHLNIGSKYFLPLQHYTSYFVSYLGDQPYSILKKKV